VAALAPINRRALMVMSVLRCPMDNSVGSFVAVNLVFVTVVVVFTIKCFLVKLGPYHL